MRSLVRLLRRFHIVANGHESIIKSIECAWGDRHSGKNTVDDGLVEVLPLATKAMRLSLVRRIRESGHNNTMSSLLQVIRLKLKTYHKLSLQR